MKKFRFRLSSVLRWRLALEEKAGAELFRARQALVQEERTLHGLKEKRQEGELRLAHSLQGKIDGSHWREYRDYVKGLEVEINIQNQRVLEAQQSLEKAQKAYTQARKDFRVMELLEEKAHILHRRQLRKLEGQRNDEWSLRARQLGYGQDY